MLVSKKFKEVESDIEGVNNSYKVINDVMNDWMESRMVQNVVNEKNEIMNINQNCLIIEKIIGVRNKRVEFFIRLKTTSRFYELKSSVWDKCLKE